MIRTCGSSQVLYNLSMFPFYWESVLLVVKCCCSKGGIDAAIYVLLFLFTLFMSFLVRVPIPNIGQCSRKPQPVYPFFYDPTFLSPTVVRKINKDRSFMIPFCTTLEVGSARGCVRCSLISSNSMTATEGQKRAVVRSDHPLFHPLPSSPCIM